MTRQDVCLAQLDRAFGYGPKGRGFESSNTRCVVDGGKALKMGIPAISFVSFLHGFYKRTAEEKL